MHGYEDDALWSDFASTMFPPTRAESAASLVGSSPLLDFPAGSRVLDLCCGPGLFVVPLAARGYTVTDVDLSPSMLERARDVCDAAGSDVRLERADMLTYAEPGAFDVVLNVFTSFGYFEDAWCGRRSRRSRWRCRTGSGPEPRRGWGACSKWRAIGGGSPMGSSS